VLYWTAPRTTPNPDFKILPLFDAEYLKNGRKYRHSYNKILIGTYTRPIKGYHFEMSDLDWLNEIFNDTKHRAVSLRQLSFLLHSAIQLYRKRLTVRPKLWLYTVSGKKRDRQYFGHNFDKFKYVVVIFARNIMMVMWNYQHNQSPPHLISVATLPCELDSRHVGWKQWRFWGFHFGGHWGGDTFIWGGGHTTNTFVLNYQVCNRLYQIIGI